MEWCFKVFFLKRCNPTCLCILNESSHCSSNIHNVLLQNVHVRWRILEVLMSHRQLVLRLLTKAQCITVAYTWGNKYQTFPWLTLMKIYLMSGWSFWLNYFSLQYFPLYQCRQTSWWTASSLLPWRRLYFWMWAVIFPVSIGEVKHIFTFGGKCHCHQTFTLSAEFFRHGILQKYELEFWFFG